MLFQKGNPNRYQNSFIAKMALNKNRANPGAPTTAVPNHAQTSDVIFLQMLIKRTGSHFNFNDKPFKFNGLNIINFIKMPRLCQL